MNRRDLPSPRVERVADAQVPTEWGTFTCVAYRGLGEPGDGGGVEQLAFVAGRVDDGAPVLVRLHSECLTGDVFGSRRCDCGQQLAAAMQQISAVGRGVVVYLRGHEGRGIGLAHKIHAYSLQDRGLDTVDANLELGLPVDSRDYRTGADILADLGIGRVRLITNNPAKQDGLELDGIEVVERVALPSAPTPENLQYLRTKRDRLGHLIELGD